LNAVVAYLCALWLLVEALRQTLAWWGLRLQQDADADAHFASDSRFDDIEVLQAVRSGDPQLAETLAAVLAELGGRGAHLHWLVDEDDGDAQTAVQQALQAQPQASAQVRLSLHPPCPARLNPKLFKLDRALGYCERDYVLVLDDDAMLPAASLQALRETVRGTGPISTLQAATALPVYRGVRWPAWRAETSARGLGAALLARFVNDQAALTYLPGSGEQGGLSLNGMCWLMRRDALEALGGFAPQLGHLTDDLAMAQAIRAAGGRILQRHEPVWLSTSLDGLGAYRRQMQRWMLFAQLLLRTLRGRERIRVLVELGLPQLLPLLALIGLLGAPSWIAAGLAVAAFVLHVVGRRALQQACTQAAPRAQPLLSLLSMLLLPLHALHAALDRRIVWRHHLYRVRASDNFEEIR
jgi:ceramide glucosyltransferase